MYFKWKKYLNSFPQTLFSFVGEKSGNDQEELALQNASKQIVQTAILQAVQQVSQETQQKEKRVNSSVSLQLERGELTKKHEKK
ncbi:A-kinase anchor protein inhibitor 1 [Pelodiscus sinensis]|uniref:A-kinase anchor protein inhibitor 1 n=1 Tax=Pelodiscus sinensis TaxID=13735 RepID=UPI003F6B980A